MSHARRQYPFHLIEPKWQAVWDQQQTFRAWNPGESRSRRIIPLRRRHGKAERLPPKYYILDMFPYPQRRGIARRASGRLHGHGHSGALPTRGRLQCAASDGLGRVRFAGGTIRDQDRPASAQDDGGRTSPRSNARSNRSGFSYDWTREVDTTDPKYFKWTQWIFLKLYNSWFNPEDQQGGADRDTALSGRS